MKKLLFIASVGLLFSCNATDCNNGEQDGNETGVDCGGDCPPCQNNNTNNTNKAYLNPNLTYGSVTDIDGNEYATIQIGTQIWMAENLNTTKYCNGDPIPNVIDPSQWYNLTTGAWLYYDNNNPSYTPSLAPYGKLYNWYAVIDSRNICPCNWHVPTWEEWTILTDYLTDTLVEFTGGKMKSTGTEYWHTPNALATNESGFSGLPGGFRATGAYDGFDGFGYFGHWWSSTEGFSNGYGPLRKRTLSYSDGIVNSSDQGSGLSVRCIKD